MKKNEKYGCKGCGHTVKCDPKEVPFYCSDCGAIDFPFIKKEKVIIPEKAMEALYPSVMKGPFLK